MVETATGGERFSSVALDWDEARADLPCRHFRLTDERDDGRNPPSPKRENLTIIMNYNEYHTWSLSRVLHAGSFSCADLCLAGDLTILCFYERGAYEALTLARFDLAWLEATMEVE